MGILRRQPAARVPHIEPGFNQPDFVSEYSAETGRFPVEFQPVLGYLADHLDLQQPTEVLEIGPGPGWMAILLAKSHPQVRVTGIDLSTAFVEMARENSRREGVADRVNFTIGDAATMTGIADHSFDAVISHQSLHYWEIPELVFDQIARVLKPTGVVGHSVDRRDMNWLGRLQVILGRCCLSRRIGKSWSHSVAGCLTPEEVQAALQRSQLRDRASVIPRNRIMLICGTGEA